MVVTRLRNLPSIDSLLRRDRVQALVASQGRIAVRNQLRILLAQLRKEMKTGPESWSSAGIALEIEQRLEEQFARGSKARIGRVINATGVVLHTNLGRARLGSTAVQALVEVASSYCNLEYDLEKGQRGERGVALEALLCSLFACEAAAVVNNCAAAVLICLNTLAEHGEVIVSRGELIEIGGSFRIPDVIAKSGAVLREVGTTNRTRRSDYEQAISEQTRVILRAHPSNYRIVGFTERPSLEDLSTLAKDRGIPLFEDLGSGSVLELSDCGIMDEPTIAQSLKAGVSLLAFSGDKLFGGPQAGIILGESALISRIKRNPLFRALRVDKLTIAALEATVSCYATGRGDKELPTQLAVRLDKATIERRSRQFKRRALKLLSEVELTLVDGFSAVGGGSAPQAQLPTILIRVAVGGISAGEIEQQLRRFEPPIIGRILDDQFLLDLRTVTKDEESDLLRGLLTLRAPGPAQD